MLISLIPNYEKIMLNYNETKKILIDENALEWLEGMKSFDNYFKPISKIENDPFIPDGLYYTIFNTFDVIKNKGIIIEHNSFNYPKLNIGICDSWENVLEYYPEIFDENRKFFVTLTYICKETIDNDWRWSEHGNYIGNQKPKCRYFIDEPKIKSVFTYHIYELI